MHTQYLVLVKIAEWQQYPKTQLNVSSKHIKLIATQHSTSMRTLSMRILKQTSNECKRLIMVR